MIPFSHPHDSDQAGLRDYRARVEEAWDWPPSADAVSRWYRHWLMLALVALLALMAVSITAGCAWNYPPKDGRLHLDAPHPSAARIAELARVDSVSTRQSTGWLRLSSAFVLAGGAVRLTCLVPAHDDQRALRLALVDGVSPLRTQTHQKTYDELLIENVACGNYVAVCDSLANSARVLVHLEQPFISRGSCNAEGDK